MSETNTMSVTKIGDAYTSLFKSKRLLINQVILMLTFFSSALISWKVLSLCLNTSTPVVVILTGSMMPAYRRGDVMVVDNRFEDLKVGDIVIYNVQSRNIPIVHRIHVIHDSGNEEDSRYLTKGDNNQVHDQQLYQGAEFLSRDAIYGKSYAYAPYFGMFTIWTTDYPYLRYILIFLMGAFILIGKE